MSPQNHNNIYFTRAFDCADNAPRRILVARAFDLCRVHRLEREQKIKLWRLTRERYPKEVMVEKDISIFLAISLDMAAVIC